MANVLRSYQRRIIDAIGNSNAIVKMPTGSGKTIVAAQMILNHLGSERNASLKGGNEANLRILYPLCVE
jgi:ERCC4-related helicase